MSSPPVGSAGSDKSTRDTLKPGGVLVEYSGLCTTCNLAPSCSFRERSQDLAIWECDLFEDYQTPSFISAIEPHIGKRGAVMAMLEEIQSKYGYLPPQSLNIIAEKSDTALVDIYGVVTFYKHFSLQPRGEHTASVCLGTACHVRGGPMVVEEFERQLDVKAGNTTSDRSFTLETVACLGACALGPIVVVDGHYFSHVSITDVTKILKKTREGLDKVDIDKDRRIFPIEVSCPSCNRSLMDMENLIDDRPSIKVTTSAGDKHGWLRLTSLYGSYNAESEFDLPKDAIVNFFCPHCHTGLNRLEACPECTAPIVSMVIPRGGIVQICSRRGCRFHMLDVNGSEQ